MIEDKHSELAKHIRELQTTLERPYSQEIDKSLLDNKAEVDFLNKEIANINPDYMTFFPSYFWYFYFGIGWLYFSTFWLCHFFLDDIGKVVFIPNKFSYFDIIITFFWVLIFGTPLFLLLYQLIRKTPIRTQYYFLKKEQKVAYYYRPISYFFKPSYPFELKIVDYKDIIAEIHTMQTNNYTPLNLYVADEETGNITHHIRLHDVRADPHVHWAFIRTYMESPAEDMPIDPKICQAYPADTSGSLFAYSDIIYRKQDILNKKHSGGGIIIMLMFSSLFVLGHLLQGNNYQCSKQAILHPEVKKLLTWDGKNNPYPIAPITPQAEKAFKGKNWQVNIRWIIAIAINLFLFISIVIEYNS
ncbi:DUF6708 domain-containing protein [Psychrobacter sp. I-STPA6b]|uniref:DUF6708 domain-containing protein n=1 Tax=Psychrobacter sp. I-STPA6b TaxID=2585718 RepID=UPI001D0C7391|nr:DUF6708 domain-containing protein [Psychrobacter sp. I-STPA6b]